MLRPYKREVQVEMFGIVWMPYYVFGEGEVLLEAPAFHEPHREDAL